MNNQLTRRLSGKEIYELYSALPDSKKKEITKHLKRIAYIKRFNFNDSMLAWLRKDIRITVEQLFFKTLRVMFATHEDWKAFIALYKQNIKEDI